MTIIIVEDDKVIIKLAPRLFKNFEPAVKTVFFQDLASFSLPDDADLVICDGLLGKWEEVYGMKRPEQRFVLCSGDGDLLNKAEEQQIANFYKDPDTYRNIASLTRLYHPGQPKYLFVDDDPNIIKVLGCCARRGTNIMTELFNPGEPLLLPEGIKAVISDSLGGAWQDVHAMAQERGLPFIVYSGGDETVNAAQQLGIPAYQRLHFKGNLSKELEEIMISNPPIEKPY